MTPCLPLTSLVGELSKEVAGTLAGVEEVAGDPNQQVVTVTCREGMVEPDGIREAIIE